MSNKESEPESAFTLLKIAPNDIELDKTGDGHYWQLLHWVDNDVVLRLRIVHYNLKEHNHFIAEVNFAGSDDPAGPSEEGFIIFGEFEFCPVELEDTEPDLAGFPESFRDEFVTMVSYWGRVLKLMECRAEPGTLSHLLPESVPPRAAADPRRVGSAAVVEPPQTASVDTVTREDRSRSKEEYDWLKLLNDATWLPDRDAWPKFPEWSQALDTCHEQALDAQARYWATVQLKLAHELYVIGKVFDEYDDERIDAGERVARLAELLGEERVEALVQEVERAFAEGMTDWQGFAAYIVPESYEGRYPGLSSVFDWYRKPHLSADKHHLISFPYS